MLLPQGTILPNFYFFSIFLQKLCCLKRLFIMQLGEGGTPPSPRCYFLLSSTPTIDTEPLIFVRNCAGDIADSVEDEPRPVRELLYILARSHA